MKATAKDLRFHSKEILETVMRGEEVIITYRGKPSAKIVPVGNRNSEADPQHKLFGIWADHDESKDVEKYIRRIRAGRIHDN